MLCRLRPCRSARNPAARRLLLAAFTLAAFVPAARCAGEPVKVPAGHRLVLVLNEDRPDGEVFRKEYLERNFPLAKAQGMYDCHSFRIDEVVFSERRPQAASFFAWSSPAVADRFREDPEYVAKYAARRAEGWTDLQVLYADLKEPVIFALDRTKHYTVALLWLRDAKGYDDYFRATDALRAELGCRVVLKQPVTRYETVKGGVQPAPHWILLVEWKDREGPAQYMASEDFKKNQVLHDASLGRIEMYRLAFW